MCDTSPHPEYALGARENFDIESILLYLNHIFFLLIHDKKHSLRHENQRYCFWPENNAWKFINVNYKGIAFWPQNIAWIFIKVT